jgi:NAD(P)-dependent dehydrogenase (short-subunit alcohol dehydrogenase family)
LLHEGHNVVALARSKGPLDELQAKYPKQARALAADLADFSFANKAAELALQEFGAIHGLVFNHATLGPLAKIADMNAEDWKAGLDINVCSAIAFVRLCSGRKSRCAK